MYSPWTNKQHYCTEYISEGEGKTAIGAFRDMILGNDTDYEGAHKIDWYTRVYKSTEWEFNTDKVLSNDGTYQCNVHKEMHRLPNHAAIIEMGSANAPSAKDNAVQANISMKKYLCISVDGNGFQMEGLQYPDEINLNLYKPCARYIGNMSGGLLSPIDSATNNYIVISGNIVLNARTQYADSFNNLLKNKDELKKGGSYWEYTWRKPNLSDNEDGAYYTMKFYDNLYVTSPDRARTGNEFSIRPYNSDFSPKLFQYNYSKNGESTDKIYKLPVIACRLKIGDKYCVETFTKDGKSIYKWIKETDLPVEYADGVAVKIDYFTIGPNPKIDDFIIGQEYPIANSVTPDMQIDKEGIAIPIKYSDELNGPVEFEILGPVNTMWNEITKDTHRHWLFFKHTTWYEDTYSILSETGQIWLNDFEVTIHSDNGNISRDENDNDLIYTSDETATDFINEKDDIEFNISTALTSAECLEKKVKQTIKLNNPVHSSTRHAVRSIYNSLTGDEGKAEEHYISQYWTEYKDAKLLVNTTLKDKGYNWLSIFEFNQFPDKKFFVQSYIQDVKLSKTTYTLKER